jgi:hypothetical protein
MVVFALGIAVYFGYLTVRDILTDLQREGIMVKVQTRQKNKKISSMGTLMYGGCLRCVGGLIGADFGPLVGYSNSAVSVSGNAWACGLSGDYHGYHHNGRRSRG